MNDHALAYLGKERGPIRTPVIFKQGTITASQGAGVAPFSAAAAPSPSPQIEKFFPGEKGSRLQQRSDGEVFRPPVKKKKSDN